MKLKLLPSNHKVVIFIEKYEEGLRIYYADGHYEIADIDIQHLTNQQVNLYKYKNPILYENSLLHPTQNKKDDDCQWINLDYLEEKDPLFFQLLEKKNLLMKTQNMYIKYKKQMFLRKDDD